MKITLQTGPRVNLIRSFAKGELRIGDEVLTSSCLVTAESIAGWQPRHAGELVPEHFDAVLALKPEIVLLGSGTQQRFPERSLMAQLLGRGVGFEVMDTAAASRTFNILVAEDRRVVAALLLHDP